MKRFGPLLFLTALIWTWTVVHSESAISFSTHVNIQTEFRDLLFKSIQDKRPDARNIQILELWTKESGKSRSDSQVEVHVTYSFDTPDAEGSSLNRNEISAHATLKKDTETQDSETWVLINYTPTRDDIQFTEGLRISAGVNSELDSSDETDTPDTETPDSVAPEN